MWLCDCVNINRNTCADNWIKKSIWLALEVTEDMWKKGDFWAFQRKKEAAKEKWEASLFWSKLFFPQKIKVCSAYVSLKKAIRTENSSLTKEVQDLKAKQNDQVMN